MKKLTVGIEVVPSIAFGRAFVEGVSRYAIEQKNWRLVALQQETLSVETLRRCDGVILRVFDDRTEQMIQRAGIAAVDVFCSKSRAGIAQVTTDEETAGRMAANFFLGRGFKNFACCGVNGYTAKTASASQFRIIARSVVNTRDLIRLPLMTIPLAS